MSYALAGLPALVAGAVARPGTVHGTALLFCGALFTFAAVRHGGQSLRERARIRRELVRAAGEWPALCRELAAASRRGDDLLARLAARGYREAGARQLLARRARHWGQRMERRQQAAAFTGRVAPAPAASTPALLVTAPRARLEVGELPVARDPAMRMVIGALVTVTCLLIMLYVPTRLWAWFLFGAAAGTGMLVSAVEDARRLARQRREVARADGEWDELHAAWASARREGRSLVELLQGRGYRDYDVRQWLLRQMALAEAHQEPAAGTAASPPPT